MANQWWNWYLQSSYLALAKFSSDLRFGYQTSQHLQMTDPGSQWSPLSQLLKPQLHSYNSDKLKNDGLGFKSKMRPFSLFVYQDKLQINNVFHLFNVEEELDSFTSQRMNTFKKLTRVYTTLE